MTRLFALTLVCLLGLSVPPAGAGDRPVFYAPEGVAIGGYDPVSYFTDGRAVRGSARHAVIWKGAEWWFASSAHRALFEADPWAYAPQFGGYCAYGMAQGQTAGSDPRSWAIRDGKLYLIYNPMVKRLWSGDVEGHLRAAAANWPAILDR